MGGEEEEEIREGGHVSGHMYELWSVKFIAFENSETDLLHLVTDQCKRICPQIYGSCIRPMCCRWTVPYLSMF